MAKNHSSLILLHSVKHLLGKKFGRSPIPDSWQEKRFSSLHLHRLAAVMPTENGKIWRPKDFYIHKEILLNSCLMHLMFNAFNAYMICLGSN